MIAIFFAFVISAATQAAECHFPESVDDQSGQSSASKVAAPDEGKLQQAAMDRLRSGGAFFRRVHVGEPDESLRFVSLEEDDCTDEDLASLRHMKNVREVYLFGGGGKFTNRAAVHVGRLKSLESLSLERTLITDDGLAALKTLPNLRELRLVASMLSPYTNPVDKWTPTFTDKGLLGLRDIETLESLEISSPGFTDAGLKHLAGLPLISLCIDGCGISDAAFDQLSSLKSLQELKVDCRAITGRNLAALNDLPSLRTLRIGGQSVSGKNLEQLEGLTHLATLDLHDARLVLDTVDAFGKLNDLRHLNLAGQRITDKGFQSIAALTDLQELILDEAVLDEQGMARLNALRHLKTLSLRRTKIAGNGDTTTDRRLGDTALKHIVSLRGLKELHLDGTDVSDQGMKLLDPLMHLRKVTLTETPATRRMPR